MNALDSRISVGELYAMRTKKKACKKETFEYVLKKVHSRMRTVAAHNALNCFYEVPNMIFGMPLFSVEECVEYITGSLRAAGFLVQLVPSHPGIIYISWSPADIKPRKALRTRVPPPNQQLNHLHQSNHSQPSYDYGFSFT